MTKIEFYFDPCCPFCWVTSRWLLTVSEHRKIDITWRQFSLAIKNDELHLDDEANDYAKSHRDAHRIQRVIRAASQKHGAKLIDLYNEFGMHYHIGGREFNNELIKEVLKEKKLPADLLKAADDTSLDKELEAEIQTAIDAAGSDIGVPTIVYIRPDGTRTGYFGPVLNELPEKLEESLTIWDGLEKLMSVNAFYELKRTRTGMPNVFSAAKC
jgi:protein-disulfide isomerase-like protein with CxxC motif